MIQQPSPQDFNLLRGWTLVALYGSLSILSLLLLYALYFSQSLFTEKMFQLYATGGITFISALYNASAATKFLKLTWAKKPMPRFALKPFLFMAVTLLFAGRLFGSI